MKHGAVTKFFTRKGLNATQISQKLDNVYKDYTSSYRTVAKRVAKFKYLERGFQGAARGNRASTAVIRMKTFKLWNPL